MTKRKLEPLDAPAVAQRLLRIADGILWMRKQIMETEVELRREAEREWSAQVRKHGEDRITAPRSRLHAWASRLSNARECIDGVGMDYNTDVKNLRNAAQFLVKKKRRTQKKKRAGKR